MKTLRPTSLAFAAALSALTLAATPAWADPFAFSTGDPDGKLASASRPSSSGKLEIESADDFILAGQTRITSASFTGLLTSAAAAPFTSLLNPGANAATIGSVVIEIYRVFPFDSNDPPSGKVPTRVNSPSDVAFESRASVASELSYATKVLATTFTAANSVLNGIKPLPNQATGGEGAVTGEEVRFDVTFSSAFDLPAGHYFFIPQVEVSGGEFFWLSSPKPITGGTGPFAPDLQSWVRNEDLAPDWLRLGTDITGQGPFNASFSLAGDVQAAVPEPASYALMLLGLAAIAGGARSRARRAEADRWH